MVFHNKSGTIPFKWKNTMIWQFMIASIIPSKLIVVSQIWISLTFELMIIPVWTKLPGIPLIHFQMPFVLLTETLLLCWPLLPTLHNILNQIIIILTLNIPSWVTTLARAGRKEDTVTGFTIRKMLQKMRSYCSVCSINKRVYYFHVPVVLGSQWMTVFIEHHHFIYICSVDWCIYLPSLQQFTC